VHLSYLLFASIGLFPSFCINNQHAFNGLGEGERVMLHDKTWIYRPWPSFCKMVPGRLPAKIYSH